MDECVRVEGTTAFASLQGDTYAYRIEYEQSEGRAWLRSRKTEREWECVLDNRAVFTADAVQREQFNVEMELLGLSLHPRSLESETCKQVTLTRSGDDLILQLSPKLYSQSTPVKRPTLALHLRWVHGSGTLPYGPSRDPPEPVDPAKPKVSRIAQRKEILAKFREENKVLRAEKRERLAEIRRLKSENDVLKRENMQFRESQANFVVKPMKQHHQRSEMDTLRRENQQLKQARDGQHAHLIRIGGANEFQRQHIEHLRRNILALQQQIAQLGGQPVQQPELQQDVGSDQEVVDSEKQVEDQQQSKRRRTSKD